MGIAVGGADFCAAYAEFIIAVFFYEFWIERLGEARPAGAGIIFIFGGEKRLA